MIVLDVLLSILAFVVVLGFLVLVHEFGHYVAGRLQGFAIDAFSIGFWHKIFEIKGRYNPWQFRWLLVGGFVKFHGESGEDEGPPPGPGAPFMQKKRWQRFLVMIMGVVFNIAFAYLLFSALVFYGVEESLLRDQPPRVGWVAPGLPADRAGIRPGDVLLSIDGQDVSNWDEAREDILMLTQKPYIIEIKRDGERLAFTVAPESGTLLRQPVGDIGIAAALPVIVDKIQKPSPALAAGLKPGDKILSLDGHAMTYFDEFQRAMAQGQGEPRKLELERGGQRFEITVTPEWNAENKRYILGITGRDSAWVRYPLPSNFVKAWTLTLQQSTVAYRTIRLLIERKVALSSLSGPVSIAYITGEVAKTGLYNLLMLMAVISLQLGILNLIIPIPALDCGQLVILLLESVCRRDLPRRARERVMMAGVGLLIILFAVIFALDVAKFFR